MSRSNRRTKRTPFRFSPQMETLDDRIVPTYLTTRASLTSTGAQITEAATQSRDPSVSANGRFVAFSTDAKLVAADTNATSDIYLFDRSNGAVKLVSVTGAGTAAGNSTRASVNADGQFVAYQSNSNAIVAGFGGAQTDIFVRNTTANTNAIASLTNTGLQANADSFNASISDSGQFVAFDSTATNIVTGSFGGATFREIYVRNMTANTTAVASVDSAGGPQNGAASAAKISGNGQFVVFISTSSDIVTGFGTAGQPDVFLRNMTAGTTTAVNVTGTGARANATGTIPSVSDNGKFVAFLSTANNIVTGFGGGRTDVFVRDMTGNTTAVASKNTAGTQANDNSVFADISGNGRFVLFQSRATDLVTGFGGATFGVFIRDLVGNTTTVGDKNTAGVKASGNQFNLMSINRDGRVVAFASESTDLIVGDTNALTDVFVTERPLPAVIVTGAAAGGAPQVNIHKADGSVTTSFQAYAAGYTGGVFVGAGDMSGDGIEEIVTSTGPGGDANIRVFDGSKTPNGNAPTASFYAYPPGFTGGVNVAIGDVNGDGFADVICGVGKGGGPNLRILDGKLLLELAAKNDGSLESKLLVSSKDGGVLIASFFGYPEGFTGGVRVAVADINNDGFADVICGVGSGGGPNVRIFDGKQIVAQNFVLTPVGAGGGMIIDSFFGLPQEFTGGVFISTGDLNNDGVSDVIIGVESGGGPNVRGFDGKTRAPLTGLPGSFFGFDSSLTGGVRVASTDINQDGFDDFVLGTGPGTGGLLRGFSGKDATTQLFPQQGLFTGFNGGVNVG